MGRASKFKGANNERVAVVNSGAEKVRTIVVVDDVEIDLRIVLRRGVGSRRNV